MRKRVLLLASTFFLWTLLFILQKPVFLLIYGGLAQTAQVMWHGLPLDLSMAGYLSAIPALVLLIGCLPLRSLQSERVGRWLCAVVRIWTWIASLLAALAFVVNLALYGYWRFPLDATPIFFLFSSPSAAVASIEWWQALAGIAAWLLVAVVYVLAFRWLWKAVLRKGRLKGSWSQSAVMLLLTALLFLPIRGGVEVSTMNTGKAYFSTVPTLNHAAVNPLFSFMESLSHQDDFASQYRFMDDRQAHAVVNALMKPQGKTAVTPVIRRDDVKDIYVLILESFSDTLTHVPDVTPNINRLKHEGVWFSQFYANSFRTDRGLVSILQGYPAPATVSLMKYPKKTAKLPSIAATLSKAGYGLTYYYGGDADFTNMRSFLINQGFQRIVEDKDFPVKDRLSKWGVPDHLLFERAENDLTKAWSNQASGTKNANGRTFTVIQTSSSHEPFDVPYHRLNNKILNAFAYTDKCVGNFIAFLKRSGRWQQSLVVIVPDHLGAWPENADNFKPWRFHIPMIWTGGAILKPMNITTLGSQQDIAATLLSQLGYDHKAMTFSKDMLDAATPHFAFFLMNDGIGMVTTDDALIYDNKLQRVVYDKGRVGQNLLAGKALLQVLFDDIATK